LSILTFDFYIGKNWMRPIGRIVLLMGHADGIHLPRLIIDFTRGNCLISILGRASSLLQES
jgi:hypothetical protein